MSPRLQAVLPIPLAALSSAVTIYLVQHSNPQVRHSASWLPFVHLCALWFLVGPVQKVLNRPGGTWTVAWCGAWLVETVKEEDGWRQAVVHGGIVSAMSFAWVRTFVGLDVPSAVALLVSPPWTQIVSVTF